MEGVEVSDLLGSSMGFVHVAAAVAAPMVVGALVSLGCGKKREPVKPGPQSKTKGAASKGKRPEASKSAKSSKAKSAVANKSSKSKKGGSKSKRSTKSAKSGKAKSSSKSKKGKSKRSAASVSGKSSKSKKSKSKEKSLKDKSGKKEKESSSKSGAPKSGSKAQVEAENKSARTAHAMAVAGVQVQDGSVKSAATQRSVTQKPASSGNQGQDANNNVAVINANITDTTREIKMEPAELRWNSTGGMQKIALVNQTVDRQAIKVKCSDNNVYRVHPVYAFVEPGQTLNVDVMRQNGSNKVDKIVFVTAKAGAEDAEPKALFKPGAPNSMMVLPLLANTPNPLPTVAAVN